jgi:hypothetical protein
MMTRTTLATIALAAFAAGPARADTFYPMLMGINPVAVQAGATVTAEVSARYNLYGTYKVFVSGDGVTGEVDAPAALKPGAAKPDLPKIKVRFKADASATPGVRDVRLATPQGASTVGQLLVVREPVVAEKGAHATAATAQVVQLPAAICGTVAGAEEVDVYRFAAKAGEAWTFLCHGQRLENRIHDLQTHLDPIITLKDSSGTVLAENDNTYAGDPCLHFVVPRAGDYTLEVRDVRYEGNASWHYCVEATRRPFVTGVTPLAVAPGTTPLKLAGYNLPPDAAGSVTVPADAAEGTRWVAVTTAAGPVANPVAVLVTRQRLAAEEQDAGDAAATARDVGPVPAVWSGRLDRPGDIDCYRFEAKAGESFTFAVSARKCGGPLDAHLRVLNEKGQALLVVDDFSERHVNIDPRIENWTAPAAGKYVLEVRDLHRRGGPEFSYALSVERAGPQFLLDLDTDKTLLAPGTTAVLFARATRKGGFAGPVTLAVEGLPPGVTASAGTIPASMTDGCILLTAAKDAKLAAVNVRVTGTGELKGPDGKPVATTVEGRPLQEIYMPGGGRSHYPVLAHTVSVADESDIKAVKVTPALVTLKPGESAKVEVEIERSPGFTANVTLDANYQHLGSRFGMGLPPGVTIDEKASQTLLTGGKSKGSLVLKADATAAPVENHQVPVMAHVSINFVMKFTYCGPPLKLTVVKAAGK